LGPKDVIQLQSSVKLSSTSAARQAHQQKPSTASTPRRPNKIKPRKFAMLFVFFVTVALLFFFFSFSHDLRNLYWHFYFFFFVHAQ